MHPRTPSSNLERARPSLATIQGLVADPLDGVLDHMEEVLRSDVPFIDPDDREVALGAVIEIIHLATLVHDDSIDQSELRRGLPTLNHRWGHKVAVIMGDYLYSRAMSEITRLGNLELIELAAHVTNDLTIGEMIEIAHHRNLVEDPDQYFYLIEKKTASLVATACEMGAVIGAPAYREPLREYGHRLGMAFQLIDDLMDYSGEQAVMGKPAGSDLREGQVTYPLLSVLPDLDADDRSRVEEVFDGDEAASTATIDRVVGLVQEKGGIEATLELASLWADRARESLSELPPTPARDVLEAAVDYVVARDR